MNYDGKLDTKGYMGNARNLRRDTRRVQLQQTSLQSGIYLLLSI